MTDTLTSESRASNTVLELAADDRIWTLRTDAAGISRLVEDPHTWVATNVSIHGRRGFLAENFYVSFQSVDAGRPNDILVHGIDGTGAIHVTSTFPGDLSFAQDAMAMALASAADFITVAEQNGIAYAHRELNNDVPARINTLYNAVFNSTSFLSELNGLEQRDLAGVTLPPAQRKRYLQGSKFPWDVLFQGSRTGIATGTACVIVGGGVVPSTTDVEVTYVTVKAY